MKCRPLNIVLTTVCTLLVMACRPGVPEEYIQPDNMEDILYDYFVSQGISQPSDYTSEQSDFQKELYLGTVLKKYGVTQAEFDSSLVYYYTRADYFVKVCKNVQQRLADDALKYGASAGEVDRLTINSLTGDTANIWNGVRSQILVPYAPYNRLQFQLKADTAYRKGDSFLLAFNSDFLYQSGSKDGLAYLAVKYENDSVIFTSTHFSVSGRTQVRIMGCDENIKEVKGFVYLGQGYEKSGGLRLLMLSNLQLIRFHKPKEDAKTENADNIPVKTDSLASRPDSIQPYRHRLGERPVQVAPASEREQLRQLSQ